jgi:hypothetical protein
MVTSSLTAAAAQIEALRSRGGALCSQIVIGRATECAHTMHGVFGTTLSEQMGGFHPSSLTMAPMAPNAP